MEEQQKQIYQLIQQDVKLINYQQVHSDSDTDSEGGYTPQTEVGYASQPNTGYANQPNISRYHNRMGREVKQTVPDKRKKKRHRTTTMR